MIYLLLGLSVNEFSAIVIVCVDGLDFFQSHYCVFGGRYILRSWSIPSQVCLLLRFRKSLYFVSLFSWTLLSVLSITPFSVVVIFCVLDFLDSCFRSVDHSVFGSRYILCPWFLWLFFQVSLSLRFRQSLYFVSLISWTLLSGQSITPFSAVVIFCVLDFLDSSFRSIYHSVFGSRYILCPWSLGLLFQVCLSLPFRQSLYSVPTAWCPKTAGSLHWSSLSDSSLPCSSSLSFVSRKTNPNWISR